MHLMPPDHLNHLPALYDTEHTPASEKLVYLHFFLPHSYWHWYVVEFDGQDTCFGLVIGHEVELGYFSLMELMQVRDGQGQQVERDVSFRPTRLRTVAQQYRTPWGSRYALPIR
jgi:hypothetical protein